jgi:hypothetical protein
MAPQHFDSIARKLFPGLLCLLIFVASSSISYAQCPTAEGRSAWRNGETVYYNFGNITDPEERRQIQLAIDKWNEANRHNLSGVQFSSATPPAGASTLSFQNGPTVQPNRAGETQRNQVNGNVLVQATITLNTSLQLSTGGPFYDPSMPDSYATVFMKIVLHELGHTMGLADTATPSSGHTCDQTNGTSVMNLPCNANDSEGNMAEDVTECDQNAVNTVSNYAFQPNPQCNPEEASNCEANGGWYDYGTCYCNGVEYYNPNPYEKGGGGRTYVCYDYYEAHDTYTCAEYQGEQSCEYQGTEYYYMGTYCY